MTDVTAWAVIVLAVVVLLAGCDRRAPRPVVTVHYRPTTAHPVTVPIPRLTFG